MECFTRYDTDTLVRRWNALYFLIEAMYILPYIFVHFMNYRTSSPTESSANSSHNWGINIFQNITQRTFRGYTIWYFRRQIFISFSFKSMDLWNNWYTNFISQLIFVICLALRLLRPYILKNNYSHLHCSTNKWENTNKHYEHLSDIINSPKLYRIWVKLGVGTIHETFVKFLYDFIKTMLRRLPTKQSNL